MLRLALVLALAVMGGAIGIGCEDDSLYKAGPSTFQNDVLDGGGGAAAAVGGASGAGAAGGAGGP